MIIAIDIGGTKIAAALLDGNEIVSRREIDSVIHQDLASLPTAVIALVKDWQNQANAIAIACTGQVTPDEVKFLSLGPDAVLPLKALIGDALLLPVTIINDAAAAAWAEYALGSHTSGDTLVYITVSTGIGGGIIQQGQLVSCNDGFSAHLGHISVQQPQQYTQHCACGRNNCVEAIASGTAIAKQATRILGHQVSCKEVFGQYCHRADIIALLDRCADAVVDLIASVKAITGTDCIVLGGSVGLNSTFLTLVKRKVLNLPAVYRLNVASPTMEKNADLIGAALYHAHTQTNPQ